MDWCRIDALSVLPASFGSQDASKLLSLCPSVQLALKVTLWHCFGFCYFHSVLIPVTFNVMCFCSLIKQLFLESAIYLAMVLSR